MKILKTGFLLFVMACSVVILNAPAAFAEFEALKTVNVNADAKRDNAFFNLVLKRGGADPAQIAKALSEGNNPNVMTKVYENRTNYDAPVLYNYLKNVKQPKLEVIKALVNGGAWYNWESDDGKIAVGRLFITKEPEIVQYWLSLKPDLKGLKLNAKEEGKKDNLAEIWLENVNKKRTKGDADYNLKVFKALLDLGSDPGHKKHSFELLRSAYYYGGYDYAKAVLDHGANPNVTETGHALGYPLIFMALEKNDAAFVKDLVNHGVDLTVIKDERSKLPPLYYYLGLRDSFKKKNSDVDVAIVKTLIDGGADYNWRDQNGRASMANRVLQSKPEIIKYYFGLKPNLTNNGDLLLNWLRYHKNKTDHAAIFKLLMENGAYPKDDEERGKVWEEAIVSGADYVKVLLENGADPNVIWGRHKTPVIFTLLKNHDVASLKLMAAHGANLDAKDDSDETLLTKAVDEREPDKIFVEALLDLKANPNLDKKGITPLMIAAKNYKDPNEAIIVSLLKHGADAKVKTLKGGRTALFFAVSNPDTPSDLVIEKLVAAGCDVNQKDDDGATPLTFAISARKASAVKKLIDLKADPKLALKVKTKVKGEEKTLKELLKETDNPKLDEIKNLLKKYL